MNRLKMLREEKDLYQSDIAKIIGTSASAVGFYERSERDMSTEILSKLADFFNVSIDYLLGRTDVRSIQEDFSFAYHKETEGLSNEDIKEALRIYKQIKYGKNEEKK